MSTDAIIPRETSSEWHDAVLRISEALCTCCEPEELAQSLANELDKLLHFDHLYLVVLKENSKEVEYRVCGKGTQLRLNYIFLVDIANPARGQNLVCYDPALVDMQSADGGFPLREVRQARVPETQARSEYILIQGKMPDPQRLGCG